MKQVVAFQLNGYVIFKGLENCNRSSYELCHSAETALLSVKKELNSSCSGKGGSHYYCAA